MSDTVLTRCRDEDSLREVVASRVQRLLEASLSERERASLALPGGTTPRLYLSAIARLPLHWSRLDITLTDERWVEPRDSASNEALLRENLLDGAAREAHFVALKTPAASVTAALATLEARLAQLDWPLDLVVLGVGDDGHVASLFPGADLRTLARVVAATAPLAPHARVSLSLTALAGARHILVIASGAHKTLLLERVLAGQLADLPIARLCGLASGRVEMIVLG